VWLILPTAETAHSKEAVMATNISSGYGHSPRPYERRYDLDWLRVFAFGMLILYHVGMFYVTWDWHVKSRYASHLVEPAMLMVNPWRLALLFLISGIAVRFATDKMGFGKFLPERLMRLFLPLVFGMAVVVIRRFPSSSTA
jgi:glucans biosynthesis protein C